jgi:hypothetical protein
MKVLNILIALMSLGIGVFFGAWYQISRQTFNSEEVIAKEIVLLEKYKNKPDCKVVFKSETGWGKIPTNDGIIVWSYDTDRGALRKVIVDKNMTSAYEEEQLGCSKESSN